MYTYTLTFMHDNWNYFKNEILDFIVLNDPKLYVVLSKGTCLQGWLPEFHSWNTYDGR